jgi:hypothetical protein
MAAVETDLKEKLGKLKKPHMRLVLNQIQEDKRDGAKGLVDIGEKYKALPKVDAKGWLNKYKPSSPGEENLVAAVQAKRFKKLLKFCRQGKIAKKAKVYGRYRQKCTETSHSDLSYFF